MKYLQIAAPTKPLFAIFQVTEEDGEKCDWRLIVQLFALDEAGDVVPLVLDEDGNFYDPRRRDSFQKITGIE